MRHKGRKTCRIAASKLALTDCSTGRHNTTISVFYFTFSKHLRPSVMVIYNTTFSAKKMFEKPKIEFLAFRAPMKMAACVILGASLVVSGCDQQGTLSTGRDSEVVLRRGISGEPSSLDPATATDIFSSQVIQDLYEGLTSESSSGEVVPGVASTWTVDSTGTQYSFILRSNARWSNGNPVWAQDFVIAWQRVLDPKTRIPIC